MPRPDDQRRDALGGWRLVLATALVLAVVVPATLATHGAGLPGVRAALEATGRISAALFVAVFAASALARLRPTAPTRWLLRNRRHLGLAFALSHTVHLGLIGALAPLDPGRFVDEPASLIPGAVAYLFVFALAATSSDRATAWLGARRWKRLHRTGVWVIWGVFAAAYLRGAAAGDPAAAAGAAVVLVAAALRGAAWRRARARRG